MGIEANYRSNLEQSHIEWLRIAVPFSYPVAFTRGLFDAGNPLFVETLGLTEPTKRHKCLVIIDSGLADADAGVADRIKAYAAAHSDKMEIVGEPMVVAGGEEVKADAAHLEAVQKEIHATAIDRHSYIVAIGGGAVIDAVGFAAAVAHRGVRLIRVPTTVLAQNDAGVGVKNAVNLFGVKNYMGTFAPPWAVLNDFDYLESLSKRDRVAGIAEAVKVGLIRDGYFFAWMEANAEALARFEPDAEEHMIRRCAELHMHQIQHGGDPFENGSARPLDFGHWAAHKLEALSHHEVRHGEAVAIGIALDARYSVLAGLLAEGEDERIAAMLEKIGFTLWHDDLNQTTEDGRLALLAGLEEFREHLGGKLTITLLRNAGEGVEVHEMDEAKVAGALQWLRARAAG